MKKVTTTTTTTITKNTVPVPPPKGKAPEVKKAFNPDDYTSLTLPR